VGEALETLAAPVVTVRSCELATDSVVALSPTWASPGDQEGVGLQPVATIGSGAWRADRLDP